MKRIAVIALAAATITAMAGTLFLYRTHAAKEATRLEAEKRIKPPENPHYLKRLTPDRLGMVKVGMTVAEVEPALGRKLVDEWPDVKDPKACKYYGDKEMPGVEFMVDGGQIRVIEANTPEKGPAAGVTTEGNFGLGASGKAIKAYYGKRLTVESQVYGGQTWEYLRLAAEGGERGTIFVIQDDKVYSFRAGLLSHVDLKEGCN